MSIKNFEEILGWQKAKELTLGIYGLFKNNRDYSFRDQIQRASLSIMNNIAEGFDRNSNADFKRFLFIARGSCGEVRVLVQAEMEFF
ncbi:four helix bundle protein [Fidelibacter multiformis]|uniref:four helix bundle protein n=1 Tax=Fidelibacter multiformis TaxID=3377529 RepID=UPI0037DD3B95